MSYDNGAIFFEKPEVTSREKPRTSEIAVFKFIDREVRVKDINGNPWFVAKEVAEILGYRDAANMARRLDIDEQRLLSFSCTRSASSSNENRELLIISESGLYSAILGSQKEEAKRFKKWITSEVLPSIRKRGVYATEMTTQQMIDNPDLAIQLLTSLKEERAAKARALEEKKAALAAQEVAEKRCALLVHTDLTYSATEVAKEIGMNAIELNQWLADKGYQFKQNGTWVTTARYDRCGFISVKNIVDSNGFVRLTRRFTQAGREAILEMHKADIINSTYFDFHGLKVRSSGDSVNLRDICQQVNYTAPSVLLKKASKLGKDNVAYVGKEVYVKVDCLPKILKGCRIPSVKTLLSSL